MSHGKGTLYLVPVALDAEAAAVLPQATLEVVRSLRTFIVENAKSARRFLKAVGHPGPLQALGFHRLDEHVKPEDLERLLALLLGGEDCGLMSEAGCPAVADPGADLVLRAHRAGVRVVPLVGPSSLLLALMASGLDGQRFAFHGYLPADRTGRERALRALEARAAEATQIFIETPYRNAALLAALLQVCRPDTLLAIAADLTRPTEFIATRTVAEWRKNPPRLERRPAVFLLLRERH
ncbi:MAG TPA: SAM-dependent methyltransferase [Burkholderiales bacterium]|nr:SAM-dependent methyltransferase [Burkholderiales bacterium]